MSASACKTLEAKKANSLCVCKSSRSCALPLPLRGAQQPKLIQNPASNCLRTLELPRCLAAPSDRQSAASFDAPRVVREGLHAAAVLATAACIFPAREEHAAAHRHAAASSQRRTSASRGAYLFQRSFGRARSGDRRDRRVLVHQQRQRMGIAAARKLYARGSEPQLHRCGVPPPQGPTGALRALAHGR